MPHPTSLRVFAAASLSPILLGTTVTSEGCAGADGVRMNHAMMPKGGTLGPDMKFPNLSLGMTVGDIQAICGPPVFNLTPDMTGYWGKA